jgi:outer membrane protein TolC
MTIDSLRNPAILLFVFILLPLPMVTAQTVVGQQPSAPSSVTINIPSSISERGFTGSVSEGKATAEPVPLSFVDAMDLGLKHNLGLLLSSDDTFTARGERWKELGKLLPDIEAQGQEVVQKLSLSEFGFRIPGVARVIGPFNYLDMRAYLNQSLFNWSYLQKERAAVLNLKAAEYTYQDARELVVLAVGNAYLQVIAAAARVDTAEAQVKTGQAVHDRAVDQQKAGVIPAIDALRSQVELKSRQQQWITARTDFAKQKLALSRIIGLPLGQDFTITDKAPYEALPTPGLAESLRRAYAARADYQAILAQLKAAELSRHAAAAEYYPTFDMEADYGDLGVNPATSNGTFRVAGTITVPIFQPGKTKADTLQAEAALRQARARAEDLRGQIDNDVRNALLDLNAAADQVEVARSSVDLAEQTLTQAQDRFSAGVTDTLEVVQAQEAVASAHESYISSLYAHNLAKVEYARAIGHAEQGVRQYLKGK